MSYNVTGWKQKMISNLLIPLETVTTGKCGFEPVAEEGLGDGIVKWVFADSLSISGKISGDKVMVDNIECRGECSGAFVNEIIDPALNQSTGEYEAVLVWEGGDSIVRLLVTDGKYEYLAIEI